MATMTPEQYRNILDKQTPKNKYNAKKAYRCLDCGASTVDAGKGVCRGCGGGRVQKFDSKAEAKRYDELRLQERAGAITGLQCQPRYPIEVNGELVGKYVADFAYYSENDLLVVEDVKGGTATDTALSKFKRKCVLAKHGVAVKVIRR